MSRIFTGPFASQILSDLGAKVIKVEPPGGDDTRFWGPPFVDRENSISGYFASLNRNKETRVLDLSNEIDYTKLIQLVKDADVVLENFRPGVVNRLNIDYTTLKSFNPDIIYLSITGFGPAGPYVDHPSYDIIAQAESGLMSVTGDTINNQSNYIKVGVPIGDIAAGLYGVIGILSALLKREWSGEGRFVSTDLFSSLTSFLKYQSMNVLLDPDNNKKSQLMGTAHPNIVPYQAFLCADNQSFVLAIGNDKLWNTLLQLYQEVQNSGKIDRKHELQILIDSDYSTNERRVVDRDIIIPLMQKIFLEQSSNFWLLQFQQYKLPAGRINSIKQVHRHPQIEFNQQLKTITDGESSFKAFTTPIKFSGDKEQDMKYPPKLSLGKE